MSRVAIYARYSCDKQKETSTEDQIRRCHDIIARHRLAKDAVSVFADGALSATGKDDAKRQEYQRLLQAWEDNGIDVIVVDEWSRLTRNGVEQAQLVARLENNRRVRLISGDGVDTNTPNWQLIVDLLGMSGRQSTRDTRHRVERGMRGQLERGYMIATPPYGYDFKREVDSVGNSFGTHWFINEAEAAVVREIYKRRSDGQSMHDIARWLNHDGVPCVRKAKTQHGGFWRASRVRNLLSNTIYRGEFVWHGSTNYRKKAEKLGVNAEPRTFARPALRLVSDEIWFRCQAKKGQRAPYGSGKHVLAGLFSCGCCGGILAISGNQRAPSLACPSCASAKSVVGDQARLTVTVATAGAEIMLKEALKYFLTPTFVDAFRESLRKRLMGDSEQAIADAETAVARLRRQQDRLSRILIAAEGDDPILEVRYEEVRSEARKAEQLLTGLLEGSAKIDVKAIEAQLRVNPAELLEHLFSPSNVAPERMRALLRRLFPSIVLEGKNGRYTSTFRICFATGVAMSITSGTSVVDESCTELRFELRYRPDNRSANVSSKWSVARLPERPQASSRLTAGLLAAVVA